MISYSNSWQTLDAQPNQYFEIWEENFHEIYSNLMTLLIVYRGLYGQIINTNKIVKRQSYLTRKTPQPVVVA
jgi:hypothetical protein